jgi:hypothetical protein
MNRVGRDEKRLYQERWLMIHQNETNRLADTEYGLATRGCKAARRCSDSFCRKLRFRES